METRVIAMPGIKSFNSGIAVSRDGSSLLVADSMGGSNAIHEFSVTSGSPLRVVGGGGIRCPCQVWVASDDHVFIVDYSNRRVHVLSPTLNFLAFIGEDRLNFPAGVCANADVVVVSQKGGNEVAVFARGAGPRAPPVRYFGSKGSGDGQLESPSGICFMSGDRHVAVADTGNGRVSVFSVEGAFIRHFGVGQLKAPQSVACSTSGELVVADYGNRRVVVFSDSGAMLRAMGDAPFTGVATHGATIFAQDFENGACVVFKPASSATPSPAAAPTAPSVSMHVLWL
jgi:DNA-binding beta-propeller fold protein YncE